MKITIVAGGLSPERDVSLSSGCLIANALLENGHEVLLLDLFEGLEPGGAKPVYRKGAQKKFFFAVPESEPDLEALKRKSGNGHALIGKNVLELCRSADVVFLALHGSIGENGQLQAVFDAYGVCYTGTGYIGSLLAMDKALSKELMRGAGLPTPDWKLLCLGRDGADGVPEEIGLPCVVKPCSCGSSVGVSIIKSADEWERAIAYAKKYEDMLLVEKMAAGREFSVGILEGCALPPIEIIPKAGFYDYRNKYQQGLTLEICPAKLSSESDRLLRDTALRVHEVLRLGDYSRVDIILDEHGGVHILEANTLPGMTPTSLLPQEAAAAGISYGALCERLVALALRRKAQ